MTAFDAIVIYVHFIADKKPEMSELHKHLVKYCRLWRAIGLKLGLKDDLLETISKENSKQYQECFRVMLQKWLIQDVSSTWNTLELAITNAQRDELSLDNLSQSMYVHMHVLKIIVIFYYRRLICLPDVINYR